LWRGYVPEVMMGKVQKIENEIRALSSEEFAGWQILAS